MSRIILCGVAALLLCVSSWTNGASDTAKAESTQIVKVTADDLASRKVVIIGRLGAPLGRMMTIRGTWQSPPPSKYPSKDLDLRFNVTHVDNKALDEPIDFHRGVVDVMYPQPWAGDDEKARSPTPSKGATWEIRGYETRAFSGSPAQYYKEMNSTPAQLPIWASPPFYTKIDGVMPKPETPAKKSG